MPLFTIGRYTAQLAGGDDPHVQVQSVSFFHFPVATVYWLGFAWLNYRGRWKKKRLEPNANMQKEFVSILGFVGFAFVLVGGEDAFFYTLPLMVIPLVIWVWRWLKVESPVVAAFLAGVIGFLSSLAFTALVHEFEISPEALFRGSFPLGLNLWVPLLAIRLAIRGRYSLPRLLYGLMVGMLTPVLINLILFYSPAETLIGSIYLFLRNALFAALPFALLVHLNAWVRGVVSGSFEKDEAMVMDPGVVSSTN